MLHKSHTHNKAYLLTKDIDEFQERSRGGGGGGGGPEKVPLAAK